MSKMTDNHIADDGKKVEEVIKAMKEVLTNPCSEQAYINETRDALDLINRQQKQLDNYSHNVRNMAKDFIEQQKIINRQQAEIERLTINMNAYGLGMKREKERADTIRAEAIKEFADRLKAKEATHFCKCGRTFTYTDLFNGEIDNLVKEMVGDDK